MLTQFPLPAHRFLPLFHLSLSGLFYLHSKNSFHLRQTKCSIAFPSVAMKMRVKERNILYRDRKREREAESERDRERGGTQSGGASDVSLNFRYLDGGVCRFKLEGLCTPFLHLSFTQGRRQAKCSTICLVWQERRLLAFACKSHIGRV